LKRNIKYEVSSEGSGSAQLSQSPATLGLRRVASCPSGAQLSCSQGLRKNGEEKRIAEFF